ncbi:MAG TPA: hypothetical protein VFZ64_10510 [Nocardioidaceae bacterium]
MTNQTGDLADIENALAHAAQLRAEHRDLTHRLQAAAGYLEAAERRVEEVRSTLTAEEQDVERLETFSPSRIWAGLKGSHASDLDRERAERDAARYAAAEAEARREAARRDVDSFRAQLAQLGDVDETHRAAVAAKERWASANDPELAASLEELARRRGELVARGRETEEAHAAGREAYNLLGQALSLLGSAESYSTWDTFLGGGMLADMAKYDKADQATAALRAADVALARFSRELADVGMGAVSALRVDTVTRTFDMFFDNIFTDMAVRSRIQDAARRADSARASVGEALAALERTRDEVAAGLEELERSRDRLLGAGDPHRP